VTQQQQEVDAQVVVEVLRQRLAEETWRSTVLAAQLAELQGKLAQAADDKMLIQQLEYQLEETRRERTHANGSGPA
jgi:hypothetical protein